MSTASERQQKALSTLNRMPIGAEAWVWMTAQGPEGRPFFVVVPKAKDPKGDSLVKRVRWIAETCQTVATPVKGVMRRLSDGVLALITDADLDTAARTIAAAHATAPELESIRLVRARGKSFVESRLVDNVVAQAQAMKRIASGEKGWFCLVVDGGQSDLRLDTAAESIKAHSRAVRQASPGADVVCGQIRLRGGRVELRPRHRYPGLSEAVSRWGHRNSAWRTLAPLLNPRAVA